MKRGFYTAHFPDLPIQFVAEWAVTENLDCLEVDFNRHIVDPAKIGQVVNTVRQVGLDVSSITLFGALLTSDRGQEQKIRDMENWPGFHRNSIATTPEGWRTLFTSVNSTR